MSSSFVSSFVSGFGVALAETGQALQRTGLRLKGLRAVEPSKFVTVGSRWAVPLVCNSAQVSHDATVLGAVMIGDDTKVGAGSVLRGDVYSVVVNQFATVGDNCIVSATEKQTEQGLPEACVLNSGASLGDGVIVTMSVIGDDVTVGDNSIIINSWIQNGATILPNTTIPSGSKIPAGETWGGNPAQRQ